MIDLTDKIFGKLTVLRRSGSHRNRAVWLCQCECGKQKICKSGKLIEGRNTSCGCSQGNRTHGHSRKSSEYSSWANMKARCYIKTIRSYADYGGRGIKVCERWLGEAGFQNFLTDMGRKPDIGYTIERDDTNGNYEPSNCYWLFSPLQARNRRSSRIITINGVSKCQAQWCEIYNISPFVVNKRLHRGWPEDERSFLNYPKSAQIKRTFSMDDE